MKNNLFWLLFGSTALGLSVCGIALYLMILFAMAQDQVLDFADDVQMVRITIEENCSDLGDVKTLQQCINEYGEIYNFKLLLSEDEPVINAEEIGTVGDKILYEFTEEEEEGFQATMPLKVKSRSQSLWLIARDDLARFNHGDVVYEDDLLEEEWAQEGIEQDEDGLDIALKGAFYGMFILLFILALFLYFPVRKLNRWIGEIQYASEQIGKQNYDVRLTEHETQPLAALASSFNGMAGKIQDHIRDKNVLANAIAHELRTPLTRFRLALGLLNRQPLEGLAKELVHDLERYTDDLEMITDNTLRLATLRDSEINLQKINVGDFISDQGSKFEASFPHLEYSVSSQTGWLNTDIGFLQLALDNLLSNGCHYAESKISIRQWQENNKIIIEVEDDGPGVSEKDVEYIQQAFTRLDKSRNRQTGGTGLGLAIVRIAVQRLEGELIFQPTQKGTCVRLILPSM